MRFTPEQPGALPSQVARLRSPLVRLSPTSDSSFSEIDGTSAPITALKKDMQRVARDAFVTVLIQGESGTGKERVASAIHRASPRQRAPFVVVNCAALSPSLVEDELFGHVRGAFTGAAGDRRGPFERAFGGTVFLDEVGELVPEAQIKLLRALQQRTVQRLGDEHETAFDVRVIAATNVDLAAAVARRHFREDLFYRLNVYELRVPPLRDRGSADLRALVNALLSHLAERRGRPWAEVDADVFERFRLHSWPGNVRELENTLERVIVAADGAAVLTSAHLPYQFGAHGRPSPLVSRARVERPLLPSACEVRQALERHGRRYGSAARELGLSRHQLYRLLKRPGTSSPDRPL